MLLGIINELKDCEQMKNYDVLNELVPKTQELHRAIFDKGYEQGFKDGANSEYEHDRKVVEAYNDGQAYILDKIRTEIEALYNTKNYLDGRGVTVLDCLKIIDKYRGE